MHTYIHDFKLNFCFILFYIHITKDEDKVLLSSFIESVRINEKNIPRVSDSRMSLREIIQF